MGTSSSIETKPYSCKDCNVIFPTSPPTIFKREDSRTTTKPRLKRNTLNPTNEKTYICELCKKSFSKRGELSLHLKEHVGERRFKCEMCDYAGTSKLLLRAHVKRHSGERPYTCDVCGTSFSQTSTLLRHLKSHSGEKSFLCEVCGKAFSFQIILGKHMRTHTGEMPYECNVCGRPFRDNTTFRRHLIIHSGEKAHECGICGKSFSVKYNLVAHMKTHTGDKPHKCVICQKAFAARVTLRNHMTLHTGEKPFKCLLCVKEFRLQSSLDSHMKLRHGATEEKFTAEGPTAENQLKNRAGGGPCACEECGKVYSCRGAMLLHKKRAHIGETPYRCSVCGRAFKARESLRIHGRTHTGEKPYQCGVCKKSFADATNVRRHMVVHTGEKPVCEVCGKPFWDQSTLNRHMRTHTGEKPFACELCTKAFLSKGQLRNHMTTHTGEKPHVCRECGKRYSDKSTLYRHVKRHSGVSCVKSKIQKLKTNELASLPSQFITRSDTKAKDAVDPNQVKAFSEESGLQLSEKAVPILYHHSNTHTEVIVIEFPELCPLQNELNVVTEEIVVELSEDFSAQSQLCILKQGEATVPDKSISNREANTPTVLGGLEVVKPFYLLKPSCSLAENEQDVSEQWTLCKLTRTSRENSVLANAVGMPVDESRCEEVEQSLIGNRSSTPTIVSTRDVLCPSPSRKPSNSPINEGAVVSDQCTVFKHESIPKRERGIDASESSLGVLVSTSAGVDAADISNLCMIPNSSSGERGITFSELSSSFKPPYSPTEQREKEGSAGFSLKYTRTPKRESGIDVSEDSCLSVLTSTSTTDVEIEDSNQSALHSCSSTLIGESGIELSKKFVSPKLPGTPSENIGLDGCKHTNKCTRESSVEVPEEPSLHTLARENGIEESDRSAHDCPSMPTKSSGIVVSELILSPKPSSIPTDESGNGGAEPSNSCKYLRLPTMQDGKEIFLLSTLRDLLSKTSAVGLIEGTEEESLGNHLSISTTENEMDNTTLPTCEHENTSVGHGIVKVSDQSTLSKCTTEIREVQVLCQLPSDAATCSPTEEGEVVISDQSISCNDMNTSAKENEKHISEELASHNVHTTPTGRSAVKSFSEKSVALTKPRKRAVVKQFFCDVCKESFAKRGLFQKHIRTHSHRDPCECNVCGKKLSCATALRDHLRTHTGEKPHKCEVCGNAFAQVSTLKKHLNVHGGEKSFLCEVCGNSFFERNLLKKHMRSHTGEKPYQCKKCQRTFSELSTLRRHLIIHTGIKSHKCEICGKAFAVRYNLVVHLKTHSGETNASGENKVKVVKPYFCELCNRSFSFESNLRKHMCGHNNTENSSTGKYNTAQKPFHCDTCGRSFSGKFQLNSHMRKHTGERPFVCEVCGKSYSWKTPLILHMRSLHSNEKPYQCTVCDKAFAVKQSLSIHTRTHTGEKPYHCSVCSRAFADQSAVRKHMTVHTGGEKPVCEVCGKPFWDQSTLRRHMKTHTGEKPFMCEVCKKGFSQSDKLRIHMNIHTGQKPYKCDTCSKYFSDPSTLYRHVKKHTS